MTADIVNLRRARKARDRTEKKKQAAQNRARFGRPKAERETTAKLADIDRARLDGALRESTNDAPKPGTRS